MAAKFCGVEACFGLERFGLWPQNILVKENIGSNRGLIAVIRELYVEYGMGSEDCTRYLTLNLDENIFWRVLKVHTTN